jgi:hypothetical protein
MATPFAGSLESGHGAADAILLNSAARTTLQTIDFAPGVTHTTLEVTTDITTYTSGGLTISIQAFDPASGKWITLLSSTDKQAAATSTLIVGPLIPASANVSAARSLAPRMRVAVAVDDATSITYSIGVRAS